MDWKFRTKILPSVSRWSTLLFISAHHKHSSMSVIGGAFQYNLVLSNYPLSTEVVCYLGAVKLICE